MKEGLYLQHKRVERQHSKFESSYFTRQESASQWGDKDRNSWRRKLYRPSYHIYIYQILPSKTSSKLLVQFLVKFINGPGAQILTSQNKKKNPRSSAKMRSMTSSTSNKGIAAIVGVGPKLGRSIARKFAHEGYTVAILARDLGTLSSSLILYPSLVFAPKKKIKETGLSTLFHRKKSYISC